MEISGNAIVKGIYEFHLTAHQKAAYRQKMGDQTFLRKKYHEKAFFNKPAFDRHMAFRRGEDPARVQEEKETLRKESTLWSIAMTTMSFTKTANTKQHSNVLEEGGDLTSSSEHQVASTGRASDKLDDLAISSEHCSDAEPRQRTERTVSGSLRKLRRTISPSEPEDENLVTSSEHSGRAQPRRRVGRNLSESLGKMRQTLTRSEHKDGDDLATASEHESSTGSRRMVRRVHSSPHALLEIEQILSSVDKEEQKKQDTNGIGSDDNVAFPNDEQSGNIGGLRRTSALLPGDDEDSSSHDSDDALTTTLPPSLKRSASNPLSIGKMIRAGRKSFMSKDTNNAKKTASTPSLLNDVKRQEEHTDDLKNFAWESNTKDGQGSVKEEVPFSNLKLTMSNPFLLSNNEKSIREQRSVNTSTKGNARNKDRGEAKKDQLPKLKKSTSNPFSLDKFMKASTVSTSGERRSGGRSITSWVSKKSKGGKNGEVDEENVTVANGTTSCDEKKLLEDKGTTEDILETGKTNEESGDTEDPQHIKRTHRMSRVDKIRSRRKSKDDLTEMHEGDAKGYLKLKKSTSNPNSLGRFRRSNIEGESNATWEKSGRRSKRTSSSPQVIASMRTELGLSSNNIEDPENGNESTEGCGRNMKRPSSVPDLVTECCQEPRSRTKISTPERKSSTSSGKPSVRKTRSRGESTSTSVSRRKRTSSKSNTVAAVTDTEVSLETGLSSNSDVRKIESSASTAPESDSERKVFQSKGSRSTRRSVRGQPIARRKSRQSRQQQERDTCNEAASSDRSSVSRRKERIPSKKRLSSNTERNGEERGSMVGSTLAPSSFACLAWNTPPQRANSDRSIGASSLTYDSESSGVDEGRPMTPTSFQNSSSLLSLGSLGSLGDRLNNSSSSEESITTDPLGVVQRYGDHAQNQQAELQLFDGLNEQKPHEIQFQSPTPETLYFDWESQRLAALESLGGDSTDESGSSRRKPRDKDRVKTKVRRVKSSGASSSGQGHLRLASNTRKPRGSGRHKKKGDSEQPKGDTLCDTIAALKSISSGETLDSRADRRATAGFRRTLTAG